MLHYLSTQSMWNLLKENMKSRAVHDESWWSLSTQKMAKNIWMRKELISQFRRYYHCDCNLIFSLLTEAPLHIHRKRRITMSANRWILAIFQLGWIPSWISYACKIPHLGGTSWFVRCLSHYAWWGPWTKASPEIQGPATWPPPPRIPQTVTHPSMGFYPHVWAFALHKQFSHIS